MSRLVGAFYTDQWSQHLKFWFDNLHINKLSCKCVANSKYILS